MKYIIALAAVTWLAVGCDSPRNSHPAATAAIPAPAAGTPTKTKEPSGAVEALGYVLAAAGLVMAGIGVYTLRAILNLLLSRRVGDEPQDPAGGPVGAVRPANLAHLWWVFLAGLGGGTVLIGLSVLVLR